jgi:hypothetical protein
LLIDTMSFDHATLNDIDGDLSPLRKEAGEEQSSSNTWRTISAEERKQEKGKA